MIRNIAWAAMATLLTTSAAQAAAQAAHYTLQNLSALYGGDIQFTRVNNAGVVAGGYREKVYLRGAMTATYSDYGDTAFTNVTALGNDGTVYTASGDYGGGTWSRRITPDGTATSLPMLPQTGEFPGRGTDAVNAVNDYGVAVGYASRGDGYCVGPTCEYVYTYSEAAVWRDGQAHALQAGVANGINNHGVIVGDDDGQGFIDDANGQRTLLGEGTSAKAVNDAGLVAGQWSGWAPGGGFDWQTTAFLYQDGVRVDIDYAGARNTFVTDLNNAGQLLGRGSAGAFLYEDGEFTLLNDLLAAQAGYEGWRVGTAYDINDRGQILVDIWKNDGGNFLSDYVLLSPDVAAVAEPATYAMLLGGLGLLGATARRRARRAAA